MTGHILDSPSPTVVGSTILARQKREAEEPNGGHRASETRATRSSQDPKLGGEEAYADRMENLASGLNTTVFVRNAGEFAGKLV